MAGVERRRLAGHWPHPYLRSLCASSPAEHPLPGQRAAHWERNMIQRKHHFAKRKDNCVVKGSREMHIERSYLVIISSEAHVLRTATAATSATRLPPPNLQCVLFTLFQSPTTS